MIWLDVLPAVSAVVTVAGISFKAGQMLQKLNHNTEDIKELQTDMREVKAYLKRIDAEIKDLDKRVTVLESTTVKITKK